MKGKKRRKEAIERGLPEAPRGCPAVPLTACPARQAFCVTITDRRKP